MSLKLVSVIIVVYHSEAVIKNCLNSINKYNDIGNRLEVVIIDNANDKISYDSIIKNNFTFDLKYIANVKNGGFGAGNNDGVKKSTGEFLLFLNPDTILTECIFSKLVEKLSSKENIIIGFTLIDKNGTNISTYGLLPEFNFIYMPSFFLNFIIYKNTIFNRLIFPWGADLGIKRDLFYRIGMFDENIFLCNEEPDLVHRIKKCRTYILSAKIIHLEGHTTKIPENRLREQFRSTKYYFHKYLLNYKKYLYICLIRVYIKKIIYNLINNKDINLQLKIIKEQLGEML